MRYRYQECVDGNGLHIQLTRFNEVKLTPKGAWVTEANWFSEPRFVLNGTGKRYCHETKEMAWYAFKKRKTSHVRHLTHALNLAKSALDAIKDIETPFEQTTKVKEPDWFGNLIFD